jgi:ribose-phosphate pyrophosphokinase
MIKAIHAVNNAGASEVYAWATHGVRHTDNNVPQKLQEIDGLKYLLISNSVAETKDTGDDSKMKETCSKIRKLSIAPLLSEAVSRALNHESIRTILDMKLSDSGK